MNIELRIRNTPRSTSLVDFLNQEIMREFASKENSSAKTSLTIWGATIRHISAKGLAPNSWSKDKENRWKEQEGFFVYRSIMPWKVPDIQLLARLTAEGGLCEGESIYLTYSASRFSDECGYDEVSKGYHLASWHSNVDYTEFIERISGEIDKVRSYMNPRPDSDLRACLSVDLPMNTDKDLGYLQLKPEGKAKEYYHEDRGISRTVNGDTVTETENYGLKCYYSVADLDALSASFGWVAEDLESMTYWQIKGADLDQSGPAHDSKHHHHIEDRLARKAALRRMADAYSARDEYGIVVISKKKALDEEVSWKEFEDHMSTVVESAGTGKRRSNLAYTSVNEATS